MVKLVTVLFQSSYAIHKVSPVKTHLKLFFGVENLSNEAKCNFGKG